MAQCRPPAGGSCPSAIPIPPVRFRPKRPRWSVRSEAAPTTVHLTVDQSMESARLNTGQGLASPVGGTRKSVPLIFAPKILTVVREPAEFGMAALRIRPTDVGKASLMEYFSAVTPAVWATIRDSYHGHTGGAQHDEFGRELADADDRAGDSADSSRHRAADRADHSRRCRPARPWLGHRQCQR
jgi:hypothetical protein